MAQAEAWPRQFVSLSLFPKSIYFFCSVKTEVFLSWPNRSNPRLLLRFTIAGEWYRKYNANTVQFIKERERKSDHHEWFCAALKQPAVKERVQYPYGS